MTMSVGSPRRGLRLPARGTPESDRIYRRGTAAFSLLGGLVMLAVAPLLAARLAMTVTGLCSLALAGFAALTAASARGWTNVVCTAATPPLMVMALFAAEHGTALRLGPAALLGPVMVTACLRSRRELVCQALWAQLAYGAYLALTLPAGEAAVGAAVSGATLAFLPGLLSAMRDRLDELVRVLRVQAETDPLTGACNRAGFRLAIQACGPERAGLLMLDLDHFKKINDLYGHEEGDAVLVWFAGLLATSTRPDDVVARYGGEEFVIYLPGADSSAALQARAEQIRARVEAASVERGTYVTVSIGATSGYALDLDGLLRAADAELYAAKGSGRNAVRVAVGGS